MKRISVFMNKLAKQRRGQWVGNLWPVIGALTKAFQLLSKVLPGTGRPHGVVCSPGPPYLRKHFLFQATLTQTEKATLCCECLQHPEAAPNEPTFPATQKAL